MEAEYLLRERLAGTHEDPHQRVVVAVRRSRRASNRQSWTWATNLGAHGVLEFHMMLGALRARRLSERLRLPRSIRTGCGETP